MKKVKLIALCAAVLAGLGIYQFLKELSKPQETPRTMVVVAAVDIRENTLITADMVTLQPVATEALLPNHLLELESAVGKVLSSDVFAGEQIVTNRLVPLGAQEDQSGTLAYALEPGMRALTISVNSVSGLAYLLRPGNRVDIMLNYSYEKEKEPDASDPAAKPEKVTINAARMLVQDASVLAVGSVLSRDGSAEYANVTLQLSPEDALTLAFAEYNGSLRLVLRSPLDEETTDLGELDIYALRGEEDLRP